MIMDAFSYTDIFDTKGIEYIVVIAFLAILIPTWILLNRPVKKPARQTGQVRGLSLASLRIPQGLFYNTNHTWAFIQQSGIAKIGVDDLLLHMTGGVSVDFLKKEGETVRKGEWVARIFSGDRELKIPSPVSGEIRKTNSSVQNREGYINTDPYEQGWLCQIKPGKWKEEVHTYRMNGEAEEWTGTELERCREFVVSQVKPADGGEALQVMLAGGELTDHPLASMPAAGWIKFQQEFLD